MKEKTTCEEISISFENCCLINGERWFFANELNALCCMDKNNNIVFKGIAPGENDSSIYLFADIKYFDNKIYLIPRGASALIVYDMIHDTFKRYELDTPSENYKNPYVEYLKFSIGLINENKLYMIPRTYPAIVVFDIMSETLYYETDWVNLLNNHIFEGEAYFWADYCLYDNELILASANSDCIVRRSFDTNDYSVQYISNDSKGFSGIEIINGQIFLCSRKDGSIIYIDKNGVENRLPMPDELNVRRIIGYSKLLKLGEYIYAIPMWANYFVRINIDNHQIELIKNYDDERNGNEAVATCCAWIEDNNICIDNNLRHVIETFSEEKVEKITNLVIEKRFFEDRIKSLQEIIGTIQENKKCSLCDYLNYIINSN